MTKNSGVERPDTLDLDSTQTIRAFTLSELHDPNQQRWFVVQLVVSDRPINLETMPRLDVFASYRLYVITGRYGATTRYSLRLGFFDQEQSAQTICGYVKTFFRSPSVLRVSAAERERFVPRSPAESPSKTTATSHPKVVELDAVRARLGRSVDQRDTPASASGAPAAAVSPPTSHAQKTTSRSQKVVKKAKSLAQELLEEARQIELAKRGGGQQAREQASWLARLLGRPKS